MLRREALNPAASRRGCEKLAGLFKGVAGGRTLPGLTAQLPDNYSSDSSLPTPHSHSHPLLQVAKITLFGAELDTTNRLWRVCPVFQSSSLGSIRTGTEYWGPHHPPETSLSPLPLPAVQPPLAREPTQSHSCECTGRGLVFWLCLSPHCWASFGRWTDPAQVPHRVDKQALNASVELLS